MTAGDISKAENVIVDTFLIAPSQNITLGMVVFPLAAGITTAAYTTTIYGPYFMALQSFTYASSTPEAGQAAHTIRCLVSGYGEPLAAAASAVAKGQYVQLSATAGSVDTCSASPPYQSIVGISMGAIATTSTSGVVLFGHFP